MAAWMAHLCVSLALAAPVCRHGEFWLHIWDGAMTLVALAAFLVSMRGWRATRGTSRRAGGPAARSAFLALVGMLASGYSLFLIGAEAVPILFINGCR
jgi:hypothetical protein